MKKQSDIEETATSTREITYQRNSTTTESTSEQKNTTSTATSTPGGSESSSALPVAILPLAIASILKIEAKKLRTPSRSRRCHYPYLSCGYLHHI